MKAIDCFKNITEKVKKQEIKVKNKNEERKTYFIQYIKDNYEFFNDLDKNSEFLKIIDKNIIYISEAEYQDNKNYYDGLFDDYLIAVDNIYRIANFHDEIIEKTEKNYMENDYGEVIELPDTKYKVIKHIYETKKEYKEKLKYYYDEYFKSVDVIGKFDYLNNKAKREWFAKDYYDQIDKFNFSGAECLAYRDSFIKYQDEEDIIYKKNSYWDKENFFDN